MCASQSLEDGDRFAYSEGASPAVEGMLRGASRKDAKTQRREGRNEFRELLPSENAGLPELAKNAYRTSRVSIFSFYSSRLRLSTMGHGQHLAFDQDKHPPLSNVLLTMAQRMGVESDEFRMRVGLCRGWPGVCRIVNV